MTIMKAIIICISSVLQAIIIDEIFKSFGERRYNKRWIYIVSGLLYAVINTLFNVYIPWQAVFVLSGVILMAIFTLLYKVYFWKRIFLLALTFILLTAFEILIGLLVSAFFKSSVEQTLNNIGMFVPMSIGSKLILLGLVKALTHFTNKKKAKLQWQTLLMLVMLPLFSIIVFIVLSYFIFSDNDMTSIILVIVSTLMLLISNIVVFFVFDFIEKQKEKEIEISNQAVQLELEKQYYFDLTQKYVVSNKTYHDLKHKLYAIDNLIDSDINSAKNEIKKVCNLVESANCIKYTGNDSVDSLLNAKINVAKEKNIAVKVTSWLSDFSEYNIIDICVILGNIFDNSIKATNVNQTIELDIKQLEGHLSITMYNPVGETKNEPRQEMDKLIHGYGLKNVQEIVQNYNGYCRYGIADNRFVINILL